MSLRAAHPTEERLFEEYVASHAGEPMNPQLADHLGVCTPCRARFDELAAFFNELRAEADAEADMVFSAERLRVQQQQIARRLEYAGRPARIISFPARVSRRVSATASRVGPRWVAAAAAAGLLVGAAGGMFYDASRPKHVLTAAAPVRPPVEAWPAPRLATSEDDATLLTEVDLAIDRPRTRELQPLDTFTPHVREIKAELR